MGVLCATTASGAKKEEGGFDGDAADAILIEANSGSVLFEKMRTSASAVSMMKLMTPKRLHAIKRASQAHRRYRISENAAQGWCPSGLDDVCGHSQQVSVDDLLHGAIIHSGNDAASPGRRNRRQRAHLRGHDASARANSIDAIDLANSNGLPIPQTRCGARNCQARAATSSNLSICINCSRA